MRAATGAILGTAIVVGACLRFGGLATDEMTADEGASWAAASAPAISDVVRLHTHLNAGKTALHDVLLHIWMRAFGDSLLSMRSLSATFGTAAIVLVFLVVRELLNDEPNHSNPADRDLIGAVAALLFAMNVPMILHSRQLRMYSLLIAVLLVQIWFFLRALRIGGLSYNAGLAIFSALSVAAHFFGSLVIAAECIYLAPRLIDHSRREEGTPLRLRAWRVVAAFIAGAVLLAPFLRKSAGAAYGRRPSQATFPGSDGQGSWRRLPCSAKGLALPSSSC